MNGVAFEKVESFMFLCGAHFCWPYLGFQHFIPSGESTTETGLHQKALALTFLSLYMLVNLFKATTEGRLMYCCLVLHLYSTGDICSD